jgi:adenosylcobinamide amidohydrolase
LKFVKDTKIFEHGEMATAVVYLSERMEVLSSAPMNGGHAVADTLFIMQVPHHHFIEDPAAELRSVMERHGLPKDSVGFMTAAEVKYVFSCCETEFEGAETFAAATAGLSNHVVAGDVIEDWDERFKRSMERYEMLLAGTINIIGVSPSPLTDAAKVNLMMPIVEAKSAALASLGYRETGTTSDAVAVVSPIGADRAEFTGTGVPLGISMARSVKAAVASNLVKRRDFPHMGTYIDRLKASGTTREDMSGIAARLFAVDRGQFDDALDSLTGNADVSALVQGAIAIDDLGSKDCICAVPRGRFADGSGLAANGAIGEQIARYVSGEAGASEFRSMKENMPDELRRLSPFIRMAVCGLIGGIVPTVSKKRSLKEHEIPKRY